MPRGEHFVEFIFLELVGLLESIQGGFVVGSGELKDNDGVGGEDRKGAFLLNKRAKIALVLVKKRVRESSGGVLLGL